jgi:hypothetical protein
MNSRTYLETFLHINITITLSYPNKNREDNSKKDVEIGSVASETSAVIRLNGCWRGTGGAC